MGKPEQDVIVVGAGPVGLSLALGLARHGVKVLVLEKEAGTAEYSRAPAIWPRTQEILAELGVLERFAARGILKSELELWDADRRRVLLRLPIRELQDETPYPRLLILPQSETERLLHEALLETATGKVEFESEVTRVVQDGSRVSVFYQRQDLEMCVDAHFLVGCDGAHSAIREQIGGQLEGMTYSLRAALADVRISGSEKLPFPRLTTRPKATIALRIDTDTWRLIIPFGADESDSALQERVETAMCSLFPVHDYTTGWQSDFSLHQRISSRWVDGRVVLAGDAAHLNSPVGGEGMNAGIIDTESLCKALRQALQAGNCAPIAEYAALRREEIASGVNRFTDLLTRLLLFRGGSTIRPILRLAGLVLRIPAIRHRVLRRLALLDDTRH